MNTAERDTQTEQLAAPQQNQPHLLERIGQTPLLPMGPVPGTKSNLKLWAKWEGANPSGSLKDRVVARIVCAALDDGSLRKGMTVVEASSGNTGISMGLVGALLNVPMRVYMPETKSLERRRLMRFWNVDLHLTTGDDPNSHIRAAEALVADRPDEFFYLNQNGNPLNVTAHALGTAAEIWEQTKGSVDTVIAALGTSGTLMGLSSWLKNKNPAIEIISVQPAQAQNKIEGLLFVSDDYTPPIYDHELVNQTLFISDDDAITHTRQLALREGLFCGISSGACLAAVMQLGSALDGKTVVVVLGDRGDRYMSTDLFAGIKT